MSEVANDNKAQQTPPIPKIYKLDKAGIMGYDGTTYRIFGDIRFRAPEVIKGKPYGLKADSWSFGVILFYLLTG